ncbi:MAG: CoA-binding protein [Chitinophagaceae bacterium]|nr:CoA-binding protein [Chitinophagaceae bacterium]
MDKKAKTTLVMGASDNPSRYSYLAINRLKNSGHPVVAIGKKKLNVNGVTVENSQVPFENVDTVTLYLNPLHQQPYYDYILSLKPKRVIFNPGTENEELQNKLDKAGIQYMEACTLVMLSTGQY